MTSTASRPTATRHKRRQPRTAPFVGLVVVVALLAALGLVMVLSASSVQAIREHGSSWYFFNRQLVWLGLGTAAMVWTMRVDYRGWQKLGAPILALAAFLTALVLVPGVGITVGGSSRWLGYGPARMQPTELVKVGILLFAADLLTRRADRMQDTRATLRPLLLVFAGVGALMLAQPDLGTTLVTGGILMVILFVAGTPLSSVVTLSAAGVGLTLLLAKAEPYRWARMTAFLDPWADASNTGYQASQGLVALASGGLFGVGLGASRSKWGFLPAAHTDFIFAVIGEELGTLGALVVLGLFVTLTCLGIRAALRAPDRFGMLTAAGITAWITGQAIINMGAVVGLMPITGVPLPFVSLGGSSLILSMAMVGVLLNITRQGRGKPRPRAGS
ncbi:MAG: putative lipid II flippase FtsW [Acidimicrobiales bacterium]